MTTKYGMFREHDYLTPGAAIANAKGDGPATKSDGLNLKATAPRTGKVCLIRLGLLLLLHPIVA